MKSYPSITAIIPILNEERTIRTIVETIVTWGKAGDIIVVDDELSRDHSRDALRHLLPKIHYMVNKKGAGKSEAMYVGLKRAKGELIIIVDGDMTNFSHADLNSLVSPLINAKAQMVIGVPEFWRAGDFEPWNDVSGTRSFWMKHVVKHLPRLRSTGYGVEVFLNGLYPDRDIMRIKLRHVYVFNKWQKQSIPKAIEAYIREGRELLSQVLLLQSNGLAPKAQRAFQGAFHYLKQALDYFET